MDIDSEYGYTLQLTGDVKRKIGAILNGDLAVAFQKSLTKKKNPKIYIIHRYNQVYYVGYAGQPIAARLRYGLNPKSAKGYAGYKWKHEDEVSITIFTFSSAETTLPYTDQRLFVEAVEAEVVYGIRNRTGRWPEYQNEIHFNNHNTTEVRISAAKILNKIFVIS